MMNNNRFTKFCTDQLARVQKGSTRRRLILPGGFKWHFKEYLVTRLSSTK